MEKGKKFDSGKPRMDLLDPHAMSEIATVMGYGAKKYGDHNWKGGLRYSRLIAASLRHIFAYLGGQDLDEETGISHIAHAACCLMMLLGTTKYHPELDDRWLDAKKVGVKGLVQQEADAVIKAHRLVCDAPENIKEEKVS